MGNFLPFFCPIDHCIGAFLSGSGLSSGSAELSHLVRKETGGTLEEVSAFFLSYRYVTAPIYTPLAEDFYWHIPFGLRVRAWVDSPVGRP